MERTYRIDAAGKALIGKLQMLLEVLRHHRRDANVYGDHLSVLGDWRELRLVDLARLAHGSVGRHQSVAIVSVCCDRIGLLRSYRSAAIVSVCCVVIPKYDSHLAADRSGRERPTECSS